MTSVALRIVLDVSYATRIQDKRHVSWHVHYLVKFNGDS